VYNRVSLRRTFSAMVVRNPQSQSEGTFGRCVGPIAVLTMSNSRARQLRVEADEARVDGRTNFGRASGPVRMQTEARLKISVSSVDTHSALGLKKPESGRWPSL
jgi:hypothetical protein